MKLVLDTHSETAATNGMNPARLRARAQFVDGKIYERCPKQSSPVRVQRARISFASAAATTCWNMQRYVIRFEICSSLATGAAHRHRSLVVLRAMLLAVLWWSVRGGGVDRIEHVASE